jgi:anthranilate phosphoribosyltransferase
VQLLGVADPKLIEPVARTLRAMGVDRALVVHGAGLDEVALHGRTQAVRVTGRQLEAITFGPEDAGLRRRPLDSLKGGDPEENAARMAALLQGKGDPAEQEVVALNAGALLQTAGLAATLRDGVERSLDALRSGEAHRRLELFVEATND